MYTCRPFPALKQFIVSILSLINKGTGAAATAAGSRFEQVADQIIDMEINLAKVHAHCTCRLIQSNLSKTNTYGPAITVLYMEVSLKRRLSSADQTRKSSIFDAH